MARGVRKLVLVRLPVMIDVENLAKTYPASNGSGPVEALKSLSIQVQAGEFYSIVGPSGCGKTTALRCVGGLTDPTEGTIHIGGVDPETARKRRMFSFDFQDPVLIPSRTALQNAQLPGEVLRSREFVERAREMLVLVGLAGYESLLPGQLSGGMQARVALARALSISPQVLLMDEPFGSLDALSRDKLNLDLLALWRESAYTVIFVTHSIAEACLLSDRVAVMTPRPGRIAEVIEVPVERPRSLGSQYAPGFGETVDRIRAALAESG